MEFDNLSVAFVLPCDQRANSTIAWLLENELNCSSSSSSSSSFIHTYSITMQQKGKKKEEVKNRANYTLN